MANEENVRKWVEALRSGEYQQGVGALRINGRYCCLGVACDLSGAGHWLSSQVVNADSYVTDGVKTSGTLPARVSAWLGIDTDNPRVGEGTRSALTSLNDMAKLPFTEIADLIEAKYLTTVDA